MQRTGLFDTTQFGGTGFGALSGPMLEQLADGMNTLGGKNRFQFLDGCSTGEHDRVLANVHADDEYPDSVHGHV